MRVTLLLVICLGIPSPGAASEQPLIEHLAQLERSLWNAWRDHEGDRYRSALLDDHLAVSPHGVASRSQVIAAISDPGCEVRDFSLDEFALRRPGPDISLISFRVRQDASCDGFPEPTMLRATSLYVKRGGRWRSQFHQSTPQTTASPPKEARQAMDPRISIITLGVEDLERSIAFYRDGLGLPQREGPSDIAFFTTSGTWLSLYSREKLAEDAQVAAEGSGFRGFTFAHNVRTREEVEPTLAQAAKAGARIIKEPREASWGGYSGYFQDPDGFLWEVAWNPHFWIE